MKRAKDDRGQSLVEFALILPILVLFILGIIDFGFIFFNYLTVEEASRDAARYAILPNSTDAGVMQIVNTDMNETSVSCISQPTTSGPAVCVTTKDSQGNTGPEGTTHPTTLQSPYSITVTVKGVVPLFDPILGAIVGNNVTLTASTTMQSE